jgi:hypothetical protein
LDEINLVEDSGSDSNLGEAPVVQNLQRHTSQVTPPPTKPPAKSRDARDVWTFYETINVPITEPDSSESMKFCCIFCRCVMYYFQRIFFSYFMARTLATKQPRHVVAMFAPKSSTSTLRNHFILKHDVVWVQACDRLKIPIKTEAGLTCAARVRGTIPGEHRSKDVAARPFTKAAFSEAIIEWIVGDDLVRDPICLYYPLLNHCSQLILLSHHD